MKALDTENLNKLKYCLQCEHSYVRKCLKNYGSIENLDKFVKIISKCPHCGGDIEVVESEKFYIGYYKVYGDWVYRCERCKAWTGCIGKTNIPNGVISNNRLRSHHKRVHYLLETLKEYGVDVEKAFDTVCKEVQIRGLEECGVSYISNENTLRVEKLLNDMLSQVGFEESDVGIFTLEIV